VWDPNADTLVYTGGLAEPKESSPFIPFYQRAELMDSFHTRYGHRGRDGTLSLLHFRGWWPGRYADVENYCKHCSACQIFDSPDTNRETALQQPLPAVEPFERWAVDFISLRESKEGYKWILTMIDHSTGWPLAIPMKNATSSNVSEALLHHLIEVYGVPSEILSDRGLNFLSKEMTAFYAGCHIRKLNTSGYHPRTNGKCERFNGLLEQALFKINKTGDPSRWQEFLAQALFAVRINKSTVTGWSPFELLYGVSPRLIGDPAKLRPRDLVADPGSQAIRLEKLRAARKEAQLAQDNRAAKNKARFDSQFQSEAVGCQEEGSGGVSGDDRVKLRPLSDCSADGDRVELRTAPVVSPPSDRVKLRAETSTALGRVRLRTGLVSYAIGERVKLRNEARTKGEPSWFGPFEIFDNLGNNVYLLLDHKTNLFPHSISGNRLKPAFIRDKSLGESWALPPRLLQEISREDLRVSRDIISSAKKLSKTQQKSTSRIKIVGRFATS
jgi:hypothetical protein